MCREPGKTQSFGKLNPILSSGDIKEAVRNGRSLELDSQFWSLSKRWELKKGEGVDESLLRKCSRCTLDCFYNRIFYTRVFQTWKGKKWDSPTPTARSLFPEICIWGI